MQPTLLQPVQQSQRTAIIDILRGWALLGVALMNYADAYYEILNPGYLITVHFVMFACFLLGLAAQKASFFIRLAENKKYIKRIFWSSLVFALMLVGLFITTQRFKLTWMKYYQPGYLLVLSSMVFIGSSICWLYIAGKLKAFFSSMQVVGKMTLTNYITQNVIAVLLFSGFGLRLSFTHRIHFGFYLLFAFVIYVAQIYLSKWWLSRYHYGPIEWVWRQLSYGKRLPIKKVATVEEPLLAEPTREEQNPFASVPGTAL